MPLQLLYNKLALPSMTLSPARLFTLSSHSFPPSCPITSSQIFIMRCYTILPVLAAGLVIAAPVTEKRAPVATDFNPPPGGDITILNYALTLEFLERKFYMEGLQNYTQAQFVAAGFADPFYANLKEVYFDEEVNLSADGKQTKLIHYRLTSPTSQVLSAQLVSTRQPTLFPLQMSSLS